MRKLNAKDARVLIIGGGGREHAIGLKLFGDGVDELFFAPGNGGTEEIGGGNVPLNLKDFEEIYEFVKESEIDLIVVGPEDPLAEGIVDYLRDRDILIIGPTKAAAHIESSKIFARIMMKEAGILQPEFIVCADEEETREAIKFFDLPVVLKVDGLAAGKGAFVCYDDNDIEEAIQLIFEEQKFGHGNILVEECLIGQEMSVFVLCAESHYAIIGTAQDYKRLLDNDKGPNTGGMGSISPSPLIAKNPGLIKEIEKMIIIPILEAMEKNKTPFTGFLYCGLMIVNGYPQVIEFNCRLGDPETEVILELISNNFFDLLWEAANDELTSSVDLHGLATAFVFKVAKGYPGMYQKNVPINLKEYDQMECEIFHAGTVNDREGQLITNGGRVIGAMGLGGDLSEAVAAAYRGLDNISFEGEFYRKDIGKF